MNSDNHAVGVGTTSGRDSFSQGVGCGKQRSNERICKGGSKPCRNRGPAVGAPGDRDGADLGAVVQADRPVCTGSGGRQGVDVYSKDGGLNRSAVIRVQVIYRNILSPGSVPGDMYGICP